MKVNQEGVSFRKMIVEIKQNKHEDFPAKNYVHIRQLVSNKIKADYPQRKYKVEFNQELMAKGICRVKRLADINLKQTA